MRKRSSRFFVILVHLVGVSHHLPPTISRWQLLPFFLPTGTGGGIVGVQPWPIVLETIPVLELPELAATEPVWLQDSTDKTCLGPTGKFTECGDATLWFVVRVPNTPAATKSAASTATTTTNRNTNDAKQRRRDQLHMGMFGIEEDYSSGDAGAEEEEAEEEERELVWSFQVVDRDFPDPEEETAAPVEAVKRPWWRRRGRQTPQPQPEVECLLATTTSTTESERSDFSRAIQVETCVLPQLDGSNNNNRRRSGSSSASTSTSSPSTSLVKNAWAWNINKEGVFVSLATTTTTTTDTDDSDTTTGSSTEQEESSSEQQQQQRCLWRGNGTQAVLDDCSAPEQDQHRVVNFSVVRYRAVSATTSTGSSSSSSSSSSGGGGGRSLVSPKEIHSPATAATTKVTALEEPEEEDLADHLPSNKAMANRAASEHLPFALLKDTNPILLMGHANLGGGGSRRRDKAVSTSTTTTTPALVALLKDTSPILLMGQANRGYGDGGRRGEGHNTKTAGTSTKAHRVSKGGSAEDSYIPPARMHVHPYIAASKNEVWKDPSTGLEYFTDLCNYLGRDRKEYGRHTLTGVGQYRKGYVVKVYGIAHYVSKRDILADKIFEPYAGLSAEELRARPEFYEILRQMPNMKQPGLGTFDRTILLKINMQLSAETMRSSLHADWKFLTDEAKTTLISSSLEPRPANEDMLKTIESSENPSRCSCSQVAPEEYQADPSCCARGTELGFTWLRTGHLEVRLNGRLMDTFERSDIAEGIFYEYLRTDDPISYELRDRVVDGFPFLLAPLARVKEFQSPPSPNKPPELGNPLFRVFTGVTEAASSHAMGLAGMVQHGAFAMAGHATNAAYSLGGIAHGVGSEIDRRRGLLVKHAILLPDTVMHLVSRDPDPIQTVTDWVSGNATPEDEEELPTRVSSGRVFGYPLSRWFSDTYHAPDEIGPMKIRPTMTMRRKFFLTLVHLYLLLLLIVSFPGSYKSRTKLVVRRSGANKEISNGKGIAKENNGGRGQDQVPDIARSPLERLQHQQGTLSGENLLTRASKAFRSSASEEIEEVSSVSSGSGNENGIPLKKKSLSYFL